MRSKICKFLSDVELAGEPGVVGVSGAMTDIVSIVRDYLDQSQDRVGQPNSYSALGSAL